MAADSASMNYFNNFCGLRNVYRCIYLLVSVQLNLIDSVTFRIIVLNNLIQISVNSILRLRRQRHVLKRKTDDGSVLSNASCKFQFRIEHDRIIPNTFFVISEEVFLVIEVATLSQNFLSIVDCRLNYSLIRYPDAIGTILRFAMFTLMATYIFAAWAALWYTTDFFRNLNWSWN